MVKFLKSESGFSMVQALVLSGVIAGASLVTTKLMSDQKTIQKTAETRDHLEEFHNVIFSLLQNKSHCTQTLLPYAGNLGASSSTAAFPITTGIYTSGSASPSMTVGGLYMNNNVSINSMRLLAPGPSLGIRDLEIVYRRMTTTPTPGGMKKGVGAPTIRKVISLRIQREATTPFAFSGCYAVVGTKTTYGTASSQQSSDIMKEFCETMSPTQTTLQNPPYNVVFNASNPYRPIFVWDEDKSICKPVLNCPANQIYIGVDTNGQLQCKNIHDWVDFNSLIDETNQLNCTNGQPIGFSVSGSGAAAQVYIQCNKPPPW